MVSESVIKAGHHRMIGRRQDDDGNEITDVVDVPRKWIPLAEDHEQISVQFWTEVLAEVGWDYENASTGLVSIAIGRIRARRRIRERRAEAERASEAYERLAEESEGW